MNNFINYQNQIVELINNIKTKDIDKIWPQKHLQDHFKSKLNNHDNNGYKFFFELSNNNQRLLLNYLNKLIPKNSEAISTKTNFKPTIKDKLNGQINVLYFFANHKYDFLEEIFKDTPEKAALYKNMSFEGTNYAKGIFHKMPAEDRETLLLYVDKNYCAFRNFKSQSNKL